MKITILTAAVLASSCLAAPQPPYPIKRQSSNDTDSSDSDSNVTDLDVLQFALTLEHLENVFYKQALEQFSEVDFIAAGFSQQTFTNIQFIAHDEEAHVEFLEQAISGAGGTPVEACNYNFGNALEDVNAMISLSSVLEGIGVSAYLGGASVISSKDILAQAAAVLVSEGLHQGVQRQALGEISSANIAGTGISPNSIFTLASTFIQSCPSSNSQLPFQAFAQLNAVSAQPSTASSLLALSMEGNVPSNAFVTFVSGLSTVSVQATISNDQMTATIPSQAQGQTYVFITSTSVSEQIQDSQVLAGPAILEVTPSAPTLNNSILK